MKIRLHAFFAMFRPVQLLVLCLVSTSAFADVSLPRVFSDHAVLLKSEKTPIWGTAAPSEKVTVKIADITVQVSADAGGSWKTVLDLSRTGPGPFELVVEGVNRLVVKDVLVGEVWFLGGQSNMTLALGNTLNSAAEIKSSANPWIRELRVSNDFSDTPLNDMVPRGGSWIVAGPKTAGSMGAIGYYFAKRISAALNCPVGLVHSAAGGTPIEPWIPIPAFDSDPDLKEGKERVIDNVVDHPQKQARYAEALRLWAAKSGRLVSADKNSNAYAAPGVDLSGWQTVQLPGALSALGLPDAGVVWFRRTLDLPARFEAGRFIRIQLPRRNQNYAEVWLNGQKIGEVTAETPQSSNGRCLFDVEAKHVKASNVLAIRWSNPVGPSVLELKDGFLISQGMEQMKLGGEWLAKVEQAFLPLDAAILATAPQPPPRPPTEPHQAPGRLFNAMIAPVLPYAVKGILWYQGEGNIGRAWQYRNAFPMLISSWRDQVGAPLPFYWCQLANNGKKAVEPAESAFAELRESQASALILPNTAQAVLLDTGDANEIHAVNKKEAAERLVRIALARTYGQEIAWSGPVYKSFRVDGDAIRIKFDHVEGGLIAKPLSDTFVLNYPDPNGPPLTAPLNLPIKDSQIQGFSICGKDQKWTWAYAEIEGDEVRVWSPKLTHPVAVRYAWTNNPTCNLYNKAGLPAAPFRTDIYVVSTQNIRYGK